MGIPLTPAPSFICHLFVAVNAPIDLGQGRARLARRRFRTQHLSLYTFACIFYTISLLFFRTVAAGGLSSYCLEKTISFLT
ncbi:hypothetical protein HETIRDRAFT_313701 [Heterobasidion irregulare TC 32-1]|uniref:Uncharacterized protein n=1 Tax=Heterobasidion irregulare (strain TC 32-1) TaxID=747525 RepID=W4KG09_HETIT|nr:uncharacterized protein HETIRDRAFT_313701 [Heterobasidion irregulare TC 32-1]ETW84772.1 hypothetical protein HETIRDRAFT_313701 [Heterobasidion irregulare TC 32-1]